jgi:hypothetical protein
MNVEPNNLLAAPTTREEALVYIERLNAQFDITHPEDAYLQTINAMQAAFDERQTALLEQVVGAVLHVTGKMHLRLDVTDLLDRRPFKVTSSNDNNVVTYSLVRDTPPSMVVYEVHAGEIKTVKAISESSQAYRLADGSLRYKKKASVIVTPKGTYFTADLEEARAWAELMQNEMN